MHSLLGMHQILHDHMSHALASNWIFIVSTPISSIAEAIAGINYVAIGNDNAMEANAKTRSIDAGEISAIGIQHQVGK